MIDLKHGDCLELMKEIPDGSVDMVLTDRSLPHRQLRNKINFSFSSDTTFTAAQAA